MSGATGMAGAGASSTEYWTHAGTIVGPLPRQETEALVEREQAVVADPMPLGLAGFASATFTISAVFAGWFALGAIALAIPVAFIFGGIVQFLAGMWAFRRGNVLAATAFSAFGAFNTAWALIQWLTLTKVLPDSAHGGSPAYVVGVFVLTFSLIAFYLGVAALGENTLVAAILFILALTYLGDGIGVMVGSANLFLYIGGYLGMITALLAFYLSGAIVINSAMRRTTLPIFAVGAEASR